MPSVARHFDWTASEKVACSLGSVGVFGPGTAAAIIKIDDLTATKVMLGAGTADPNSWAFYVDTDESINFWNGSGAATTGASAVTTGNWYLVALTKASGSVAARFHIYNYSTRAWSHADAAAIANSGTPATTIWVGGDVGGGVNNCFGGDMQVAGYWNTALTDDQVEALANDTLAWARAKPTAWWTLSQPVVTDALVDVSGGGANESSRTGTLVSVGNPNFDQPPMVVPVPPSPSRGLVLPFPRGGGLARPRPFFPQEVKSGTASVSGGGGVSGYKEAVRADAPSLYWRLGEPGKNVSLTPLADSSVAGGHPGVVLNSGIGDGAGAISGDVDGSADMPAAGLGVIFEFPNDLVPFTDAAWTFEGWFYRDTENTLDMMFCGGAAGTSSAPYTCLGGQFGLPVNSFRFAPSGNAGVLTDWTNALPAVTTGAWYHVVLVTELGSDFAELFVNGVSKGTKSVTASWGTGNPFRLGHWFFSPGVVDFYWDGRIDEAAVYQQRLSSARILAHYNAGLPPAAKAASGSSSVVGGGGETSTDRKNASGSASASGGGGCISSGAEGHAQITGVSGGGSIASTGAKAASGSASVSGGGGGSATSSGIKGGRATAAISGGGSCSSSGAEGGQTTITVAGGGSGASTGSKQASGTALVSGGGGDVTAGVEGASGSATATGGGSIASNGLKAASGTTSTSGGAGVGSTGTVARFGSASVSGSGLGSTAGSKRALSSAAIGGGGSVAASGIGFALVPAIEAGRIVGARSGLLLTQRRGRVAGGGRGQIVEPETGRIA